ncbi:DUF6103 family protein [Sinanaerobacter chloroacetimidivorans]|uniref:Uncharacterized protein n=1 Tax=Sinanaerobacter chloroacetimidivorans TaxID=2818044 RepID=A0A8J7W373_9FIRM|nr:DUF6103 family protein [Sinanaerobacter chloroacetimidivorans]MBR0600047.1 hypothetical protein [Sinanaerobacter chloroacetimidivorans]
MSTTELKVPFPSERLNALRFFMEKKDQTIEQELKDYLNKTYERLVPLNVREYVESRLELETAQEQAAESQQTSASGENQTPAPRERQPRQSRRQREQAATEAPSAPEAQSEAEAPAEEEAQGMTMSM